ncbi:hypothetical protein ACFYZ9_38385 [Streptomyces sp. NPDC001691]|uniref:hypothetical protein n=1 Tax=Streptomyces sp. NPDC001691 TaxID=3364600 RepID=UPI003693CFA4
MNPQSTLTRPGPLWPLALCTTLLVGGALLLILPPPGSTSPAPSPARSPAAARTSPDPPAASGAPASLTPDVAPLPSAASSPSRTAAAAAPPRGDGPGGDPAIQQLLDRSWPRDLPGRDEEYLVAVGRRLLAADATVTGRDFSPGVFPPAERTVIVPAFTRFRIQAAIARAAGAGRAVVHLVWAGADRGGTYTDGHLTDLFFTRPPSPNGASPWTPSPLP